MCVKNVGIFGRMNKMTPLCKCGHEKRKVKVQLTEEQAKEIADIALKADLIKPEEYEDRIKEYMKPKWALYG